MAEEDERHRYPTGFSNNPWYVEQDEIHEDMLAAERINATVLCDSISPNGVRLSTLQVAFPRFVLAEFNTHRMFSRNSASSRAIPTSKLIERVRNNPARPIEWGRNKAGMSADQVVAESHRDMLWQEWMRARDSAVAHVEEMLQYNPHKQVVNRLLEPFMTHIVIVTATDWENFFYLRCSPNAQPELRAAAELMRDVIEMSQPRPIAQGAWHLPLIQDDEHDLPIETLKKVSAARCARVSYLTHDGTRSIEKDVELSARLEGEGHLSPFEHVATPSGDMEFHANFRGWVQMRKDVEAHFWTKHRSAAHT